MASPEPTPPPPPPVNRQFVRTSKKATETRGTGGVASTATAAFASTVYFFAGPSLIFLNEQVCTRHAHATHTRRAGLRAQDAKLQAARTLNTVNKREIHKNYRRLALQLHPDKCEHAYAIPAMVALNKALATVIPPAKGVQV